MRGCASIGGIAAKKVEASGRKGSAFPHIGGQSQKTIFTAFIFHLYDERGKVASQPSINFFDFAAGQITQIAPLAKDPYVDPGLSVSPDGKWLYYSTADTFNSDIMLVENFR